MSPHLFSGGARRADVPYLAAKPSREPATRPGSWEQWAESAQESVSGGPAAERKNPGISIKNDQTKGKDMMTDDCICDSKLYERERDDFSM